MATRKHIVFLTGAGISVESGLHTFRGTDGLWTNQDLQHFATTECMHYETERCLEFYNQLRLRIKQIQPNEAHKLIASLEADYQVTVITQNVDDLHERAGSTNVVHLHGVLTKVCSMRDSTTCLKDYPLDTPIRIGDKADDGSQLRPHIVLFGESVPAMDTAVQCVPEADIFVVVGSSLSVYPAAGLVHYTRRGIPKYIIDPGMQEMGERLGYRHLRLTASEGMRQLVEELKTL